MSSLTFNFLFMTGCVVFYLPSLWAKFAFGGEKYTQTKSVIAILYALFFTYAHWRFAETGNLPFLGVYEPEPMGWVSLFMVLAYAYALPSEKNSKFCCRK